MPQVRAHALANYLDVARFCGLNPYEMLRRVRLHPESLQQPELHIASEAAARLLEDSARDSECAGFGLLMVQSRILSDLGPVSLLLEHEGTARDVIDALIRYQELLGDILALAIEQAEGTTIIHTELAADHVGPQATELLTGLICRTMSELASGQWYPDSVHFVHAAPDDLTVHHWIFQCPILFECDFNGLVCASASLAAPNPKAEAAMAGYARAYLDLLTAQQGETSLTEQTRRALYLLLPAGRATLKQAAGTLGLHPRRLQRSLEEEGGSFSTLLNEVRRELALRYLSTSPHNMTAISPMTGYASPSSFTRWFTAEFGMSPAAWRAEEKQGSTAEATSRVRTRSRPVHQRRNTAVSVASRRDGVAGRKG